MKSFITISLLCLLFSQGVVAQEENTNIGGYGELHLNIPEGSLKKEADFHRFIIYLNHNFNDKWSFMSELEIEHAGKEVELEQAYLEFKYSQWLGFRAGVLLQPLGIINLYHEPPTFHGVERPNFEKSLIPTTWWENGFGVFGKIANNLDYTAQITAGLNASKFDAKDGIRGGRQKAIESFFDNPSFSGNLNFSPLNGLKIGAGFFMGNSVPANDISSRKIDAKGLITLRVGSLQYSRNQFAFKAEYVLINIGDADKINAAYPTIIENIVPQKYVDSHGDTVTLPSTQKVSTHKNIASQLNGFLIEASYNFMPLILETSEELWAFARIDKYNTQAKMPIHYAADEKYNRTDLTLGVSYKPTYNTVVKADIQLLANAKDGFSNHIKQFNFGVGYYFF
ncbi:MAG: hypothetical protein QME52_06425 [Bacteroidota bacterium]|nr:hypothetical protein [Bacteroidota bacterium]